MMLAADQVEPSNDGLRAARILTQRQGLSARVQRAASGGRHVSARQGMGAGRRRRYVNGEPKQPIFTDKHIQFHVFQIKFCIIAA